MVRESRKTDNKNHQIRMKRITSVPVKPLELVAPKLMRWLYHEIGQETSLLVPNNHDIRLESTREWCVTHRPQAVCPCGQYVITWR